MLMCCSVLGLAVLAGTATAQLNTTAQNATTFSLQYGYPLLAFEKLAPALLNIVKPNVDTLYSQAIFDLSHNDVIITIPEFPGSQFALFSYYDPYGNNFANTGTGNLDSAGQYLSTSLSVGTPNPGVVANNHTSSQYKASIVSPSLYGIILIRWLVNATNLDAVHAYQDAFTLHNTSKSGAASIGPYLSSLAGLDESISMAESVFNLLGKLAFYTGPRERTDIQRVIITLGGRSIGQHIHRSQRCQSGAREQDCIGGCIVGRQATQWLQSITRPQDWRCATNVTVLIRDLSGLAGIVQPLCPSRGVLKGSDNS
ncbi:hypothetical protein LTR17_004106 [Elasticomyces elasticus]|nr:hypothetical protein LTR17_004106 [Elasticomyces elasticus]